MSDAKTKTPEETKKTETPEEVQKTDGRTKILIPSHSGRNGSDDVFVSVNGRDFLIKRDVDVEVPAEVLAALDDAIATEYLTDSAGRIVGERNVPRFPYQVK